MSKPPNEPASSPTDRIGRPAFPILVARCFLVPATALLVACGGGSSPLPSALPLASASAVIGAAGGTVTGPDGVQVVIPAGALGADTTIGIARSSAGAPPTFADNPPAGGIYEFTPHNLVFNLPVTIRMPLASGADGSVLFMASPGEDWQTIDATVTAGVAEWTRNSFSWGMGGLPCTATATLADLYPCTYPSGGAQATATPAGAMTRTAFGSFGLYSGNAGAWAVTQAATVDMTLNYRAAADCTNPRVKLIRWNPAVPVTPANPATIVFEQPVALTPTVFSLPGGTFACTGTTNLDGTPCGSYRRAVGSTTVAVPFSHLDSSLNATGSHAFGYSFSCNRPGKPRHSGGDLVTFKVTIPVPNVTFAVGGSVTGLTGSGLVLANPGASNLPVAADGSFTFAPTVGAGTAYAVSVLTQPSGQTCTVTNASGTANTNVSNVAVSCVAGAATYTVGGQTNANNGGTVVLQNNATDTISVAPNQNFVFPTPITSGGNFNVTVLTPPAGRTCTVANGGGVATAAVSNITVNCIQPLLIATTSPLPLATVNTQYSTTMAASGGTAPYTWGVASGSLPPGFTLNASTGVLSGSSATPASYNLNLQVTDSANPPQSYQNYFELILQAVCDVGLGSATVANPPATSFAGKFCPQTRTAPGAPNQNGHVTASWVENYTYPTASYTQSLGVTFDPVTGVVDSMFYRLNDPTHLITLLCTSASFSPPPCTGVTVNVTTGTVTMVNTVIGNGTPATFNGVLRY